MAYYTVTSDAGMDLGAARADDPLAAVEEVLTEDPTVREPAADGEAPTLVSTGHLDPAAEDAARGAVSAYRVSRAWGDGSSLGDREETVAHVVEWTEP